MAKYHLLPLVAAFGLLATAAAEEFDDWSEFEETIDTSKQATSVTHAYDVDAAEAFPFRRSIVREDVTIRIKPLRFDSGKRARLVYGAPKGRKAGPAVFILDVETNVLANQAGFNMPNLSGKRRAELQQASYLLRSPFGSNLLGNGFAVAYIVAEDLSALRSAREADWVEALDHVRNLRHVDENSIFLFATREYANLSFMLASKYDFSGFIVEEPNYLLFTRQTFDHIVRRGDDLDAEDIWRRTDPSRRAMYLNVFSRITSPILIIRNPNSAAQGFNDKTLLASLRDASAYFETAEIGGPARDLTLFGGQEGVMEVAPQVSYYAPTVSRWVGEMISYMRDYSQTEAVALRDPARMGSR